MESYHSRNDRDAQLVIIRVIERGMSILSMVAGDDESWIVDVYKIKRLVYPVVVDDDMSLLACLVDDG